jgi:hypothetical protein
MGQRFGKTLHICRRQKAGFLPAAPTHGPRSSTNPK